LDAVRDLEPLSPNATSGTTKKFKQATDLFHQYTGQMHCHLVRIHEASRIGPENEWDEPEELDSVTKNQIVCLLTVSIISPKINKIKYRLPLLDTSK